MELTLNTNQSIMKYKEDWFSPSFSNKNYNRKICEIAFGCNVMIYIVTPHLYNVGTKSRVIYLPHFFYILMDKL